MLKITQPPTIFMEIAFEKSITPGNTDIMGPFISLKFPMISIDRRLT